MIDCIENIEKLSAALGTSSFYDFHDAEIVSVSFDRRVLVTAAVVIRLQTRLGDVERDGQTVENWRNFDVSFGFHGVRNCELDGFNQQNVIDELRIVRDDASYLVHFKPVLGCDLKFLCERMELRDVVAETVEKIK